VGLGLCLTLLCLSSGEDFSLLPTHLPHSALLPALFSLPVTPLPGFLPCLLLNSVPHGPSSCDGNLPGCSAVKVSLSFHFSSTLWRSCNLPLHHCPRCSLRYDGYCSLGVEVGGAASCAGYVPLYALLPVQACLEEAGGRLPCLPSLSMPCWHEEAVLSSCLCLRGGVPGCNAHCSALGSAHLPFLAGVFSL